MASSSMSPETETEDIDSDEEECYDSDISCTEKGISAESFISAELFSGINPDKIKTDKKSGKLRFGYILSNLVDLKDGTKDKMVKVDADVDKLSEQLQKTIKSFEKKFKLEVNHYYIGKTFVNLVGHTEGYRTSSDAWKIQLKEYIPKKKTEEKQSSTPPKPKYKKDEGISSRKATHMKKDYGNVGLVVLAIVTEEVLPKTRAPSVEMEDYALILEQRLQHNQLIEAEDKRCANEGSSEGRRADKNAYVIYVALGCKDWPAYLQGIKDGTANK